MNLSKTEKLIAARKKLKEYQQKKKIHVQDEPSKDANGVAKSLQQNETLETSSHKHQSRSDYNVPLNDVSQNFTIPIDNNDLHVDTEMINSTSTNDKTNVKMVDIVDISKQVIDSELTSTVLSDETDSNHIQQTIAASNENNIDCSSISFYTEIDKNRNDQQSCLQTKQLLQTEDTIINEINDSLDNNKEKNVDCESYSVNQDVTYIQDQNQLINQLEAQVRQYSNKISKLQAALAIKDAEIDSRLMQETKQLKEQLQIHMQTTSILISEKAELAAALNQNQEVMKHNIEETEELSGKLKCAQVRSSELEKELNTVRNDAEDTQKVAQLMKQDHETLYEKYSELMKEKEDLALQVSELKQKLNFKNTELTTLQQNLQEKSDSLSLSELKIQQLTYGSIVASREEEVLKNHHRNMTMLEQQLAQMKETLKTVNEERDEASKQYQNYVRQLEAQQEILLNELEHHKQLNNELEIREKSYIERLSDLEQQLQSEKIKVQDLLPLQNQKYHTDSLMKEIDELTLEQERLHIIISEKDTNIEILSKALQDFQDKESQSTDASKLAQALESEQLGASRAVSQNQQLKEQLNEMHDAFILLSNTKLDLTEQLQSERAIGRKLNAELNKVETEVEYLKNCLKEKETSLAELEKENLQNAQIADQINHYQAQSHYTHTLQQELQKALATVDDLKIENEKLYEELSHNRIETEKNEADTFNNASNDIVQNNNKTIDDNIYDATATKTISRSTITDPSDSLEPMKKLEKRFKETIEKLAELTDEKQRLEHLVLQLQSETETIGEYIALYQRQRAVLQEKAKQKDEVFRQLIEQKNEQQEQLHKLKVLVTDLIKTKSIVTESTRPYISECEGENKKDLLSENDKQNNSVVTEITNDETTSQILDLLTEIKDCKDSCIFTSNYHPCPWCSGKLITV